MRFIPAYAGNSIAIVLDIVLYTGSSPLTRGTLDKALISSVSLRFIPAYAGNSHVTAIFEYEGAVHPRLRGELPR